MSEMDKIINAVGAKEHKKAGRPRIPIDHIAKQVADGFSDSDGIMLKCYMGKWYLFDGSIYKEYDLEPLKVVIRDHIAMLGKKVTANSIKNVLEELQVSTYCGIGYHVKADIFDLETGREYQGFMCDNTGALLDPKTAKSNADIIPPNRSIFKTNCLPFKFDFEAKCPKFIKSIEDSHDDKDDQNNIYKFGYLCLTDDMSHNKMLALVGGAGTGKSYLVEVLCGLLGPKACRFEMNDLKTKSKFDMGKFAKHTLLHCNEVDGFLPEAALKDNTDYGMVTDRVMHKMPVDRQRTAKMIFCSNGFQVKDPSGALLNDRIVIIHFSKSKIRSSSKEIKCYHKEVLKEEAPGILTHLLTVGRNLLETDGFKETTAAVDYKLDLRDSCNSSLSFIEHAFELDKKGYVPNSEIRIIHEIYREEATSKGIIAENFNEFKQLILTAFKAKIGRGKDADGKASRGIAGIQKRKYPVASVEAKSAESEMIEY
jgi:hypothetical protein